MTKDEELKFAGGSYELDGEPVDVREFLRENKIGVLTAVAIASLEKDDFILFPIGGDHSTLKRVR